MKMTPTEERYYEALFEAPEGLSRKELAMIKAPEPEMMSNVVDVHIKDLRKKLPSHLQIVAIRGYGYKLEPMQ